MTNHQRLLLDNTDFFWPIVCWNSVNCVGRSSVEFTGLQAEVIGSIGLGLICYVFYFSECGFGEKMVPGP